MRFQSETAKMESSERSDNSPTFNLNVANPNRKKNKLLKYTNAQRIKSSSSVGSVTPSPTGRTLLSPQHQILPQLDLPKSSSNDTPTSSNLSRHVHKQNLIANNHTLFDIISQPSEGSQTDILGDDESFVNETVGMSTNDLPIAFGSEQSVNDDDSLLLPIKNTESSDSSSKERRQNLEPNESTELQEDASFPCIHVPQIIRDTFLKGDRKRLLQNSIDTIEADEDVYKNAARQINLEKDSSEKKSTKDGMARLLEIAKGDVGLALFIPINWTAFEEQQIETNGSQHSAPCLSFSSSNYDSDNDLFVQEEENIELNPPILSAKQMKCIQRKGLPASVSLMTWHRIYSLQRDGDCFKTMFQKVSKYQHSMIVIKTEMGDILGGYADSPWANQGRSQFFGGGMAFLFASNPQLGEKELKEIERRKGRRQDIFFYRWSGENDYSQILDYDSGKVGMGGGNSFGFFVQDDFQFG